ncbi:MAG: hypothetical protein AB8E15_05290 [Bdellovibrionales bacterium]
MRFLTISLLVMSFSLSGFSQSKDLSMEEIASIIEENHERAKLKEELINRSEEKILSLHAQIELLRLQSEIYKKVIASENSIHPIDIKHFKEERLKTYDFLASFEVLGLGASGLYMTYSTMKSMVKNRVKPAVAKLSGIVAVTSIIGLYPGYKSGCDGNLVPIFLDTLWAAITGGENIDRFYFDARAIKSENSGDNANLLKELKIINSKILKLRNELTEEIKIYHSLYPNDFQLFKTTLEMNLQEFFTYMSSEEKGERNEICN